MLSVRNLVLGITACYAMADSRAVDLEITAFAWQGANVNQIVSSGTFAGGSFEIYSVNAMTEFGQWVPMPFGPGLYYQYYYHRSTTPRVDLQAQGYTVGTLLDVDTTVYIGGGTFVEVPNDYIWN